MSHTQQKNKRFSLKLNVKYSGCKMRERVFIRSILLLFVSFCFSVSSFAQENTNLKVTAIEVKGNKAMNSITILSKMKTRIGAAYSENIINDDLKRLYHLGYFSDVDIETENYKEGVKVIVIVVERAVIEKISFSGFRYIHMKEEKLIQTIKSKQGQYLDYPALKNDVETLKKIYVKKGFSEADVKYTVDIDKENNKAVVAFTVNEGRPTKIKKIYIEGNNHFSDGRLLKIIKTKRAWLLGKGILKEEELKEDIGRIKSFYQREGFSDVELEYKIKKDDKKPYLYITINIVEGDKYFVGAIRFEGNQIFSKDEILSSLKYCLSGKVYSAEALLQDKFIIQGLYFDRGYIMAEVNTTTILNNLTDAIDITYNITEKGVVYIDKIKIRGNTKTKDIVVRRELRVHPGEKFEGAKLRRSKERLANLGFFEEISFDTQSTSVPDRSDLIVEVKEAKTGTFSFGGGYSSIDDFIGFIEVEQKNFDWKNFPYFTGDGQDLKVRAELGTVSENFNLSFNEPWLFDYPLSFGFDAYRLSHDRESDIGWGYDETKSGGDVHFGKEISEYVKSNLAYRYDRIEIGDVDATAAELKKEEGKNNISKVELGMSYDSRNNVFNPVKGILLTGNFDVAGGALGADKDFYKFQARGSKYFPLFRNSVLEFKTRVGFADGYGDTGEVPVYERFFTGGAYSIRGYEERMVGPIDETSADKDPIGGNWLVVGNIEYTYPVLDFLSLGCFFDTGNVWTKIKEMGSDDLKSGFGLGMRVKTPIGPIRLDYGIPLDKQSGEEEKKSGRLHFSMGGGF